MKRGSLSVRRGKPRGVIALERFKNRHGDTDQGKNEEKVFKAFLIDSSVVLCESSVPLW